MRIAILTFHRAFNCGAMLQAWALKTFLERMGHTVEFPRCNFVGDIPRWRFSPVRFGSKIGLKTLLAEVRMNLYSIGSEDASRHGFRAFRRQHLTERDCLPESFADYYDAVIVGSDQVWTQGITREWTPLFLAENAVDGLPYIAYAVSAGDELPSGSNLKRLKDATRRFSACSTRERSLGSLTGSVSTCDPSFLLSSSDYEAIAQVPDVAEPFLYSYTALPSSFLMRTVKDAARDLGIRPIVTPIGQFSRYGAPTGLTYAVSPARMIGYQKAASAVVTDSFHGTAFALIYGKPFVSLQNTSNISTRIGDLLDRLGLSDRLVDPGTSRSRITELLRTPLPEASLAALHDFSNASARWLERALGVCGEKV